MDSRATTRADVCNALRALAMDAVQRANSGHPGMPMGMAEIAEVVWRHHLRHNPANPMWADRDRFILSNGHGSMLIYSLLHLTGYDLPMEELKNFRQLHSKTPGHPEYGYTVGVETTTGPLGQGLSNAVGFALAERVLAAHFNRPGHDVVNHHTYTFLGDGCLMEGVSHESCALAGTLGLSKLIALYDDNGISIDSEKSNIRGWFTDDVPERFRSYGWNVIPGVDGHDVNAIEAAVAQAKKSDRPTIICCKTVIGKGAPKKGGTGHAHGAALGDEEIVATRKAIGWPYAPFEIPEGVYSAWDAREKGKTLETDWNKRFDAYAKAHPELAAEFKRRMSGELPSGFAAHAADFIAKTNAKAETIATRKASQNTIEGLAPALPELIGGSADLTGSNLTWWSGSKALSKDDYSGNYVFYGVREFGMSAVMNGLTLHGGLIPYGATFLTFSDYARNALRMAALMKIRTLFVYTHDSIGLGEDGPTHQPIEHIASLRLIPGLDVWRPCDTVESAVAWTESIERKNGPSVMIFSRQNLAFQARSAQQIEAIKRGGYVLVDEPKPKAVLIATGSELAIAVDAQKLLKAKGIAVRVVSMPATTVFDRQDAAYRDSVLPPGVVRIAVEAGVTDFWRKYVGLEGKVVGLDRFGESAPAPKLYEYFGITPDNVAKTVEQAV